VQKAEGWFALAEAHRRSSPPQREEALKAYQECLQYPNNPLAQRARLEVARLEIAQSNLADAEKILLQSLALAASTADRQAEEQALYELGKLLFQQGEQRYAEARIRLSEAVSRYPADPEAFWARDQLGTCHFKLGEQAKKSTLVADLPGEKRRVYEQDMYANFRLALEVFQKLGDDMEKMAASRKLAPAEEALLCRVRFMVPDCHSELRTYDEAVRCYQGLAQRYRGRMEGLMACESLMLCCYRCQGDRDQWSKVVQAAITAHRTAASDLSRMPDEEFRRCRNTKSRADWGEQLTRVLNWLEQIPAQPAARPNR
jgi:tetratricopeptide (TPR) repeat protein